MAWRRSATLLQAREEKKRREILIGVD